MALYLTENARDIFVGFPRVLNRPQEREQPDAVVEYRSGPRRRRRF